ncbi:hypothetical protein [Corynebacterium sp. A21]|uniref:hypothetical protein n=1 Tax=Corynebacterium sp. A21 TaxID=3457318 RepID=UPI003FD68C05
MKHIKKTSVSLIALLSLSLSGTAVATAQNSTLSSGLFGSSSTGETPVPGTLEDRLEASYDTWIRNSGLTRTQRLDSLAADWVNEASRSDWEYEYFTGGIGIISGELETGEGIEILRYTAEAAEYWAERGIGEFMNDDPLGLQGLAAARSPDDSGADYVYIVLIGYY